MKTLLVDWENGRKSLGSDEKIKSNFGFPPLKPSSWDESDMTMAQLFKEVEVEEELELVPGIMVKEKSVKVIQRDGVGIECMVHDTFTEAVKKHQRQLKGTKDKLDFTGWGKLKDTTDVLLEYINRFPVNIILNVHEKVKEDQELGIGIVMPNIEGSTKDDIAKWFDFVFYTKVFKDENNEYQYMWVTKKDERYAHAKDRTNSLPAIMPQDYGLIKNAAKEQGWDTFKCLVIGSPGSGKTMSLRTLV